MQLTHVRVLVSDMGAAYRFSKDILGLATIRDHHDVEWERDA